MNITNKFPDLINALLDSISDGIIQDGLAQKEVTPYDYIEVPYISDKPMKKCLDIISHLDKAIGDINHRPYYTNSEVKFERRFRRMLETLKEYKKQSESPLPFGNRRNLLKVENALINLIEDHKLFPIGEKTENKEIPKESEFESAKEIIYFLYVIGALDGIYEKTGGAYTDVISVIKSLSLFDRVHEVSSETLKDYYKKFRGGEKMNIDHILTKYKIKK